MLKFKTDGSGFLWKLLDLLFRNNRTPVSFVFQSKILNCVNDSWP